MPNEPRLDEQEVTSYFKTATIAVHLESSLQLHLDGVEAVQF